MRKFLPKNEDISGWKAHENTRKLKRYISTITVHKCLWTHGNDDSIFYCDFTNIFFLLIEKDICDCQDVSVKFLCVYVCLLSKYLFIFFRQDFPLYFPIFVLLSVSLLLFYFFSYRSTENIVCYIICTIGRYLVIEILARRIYYDVQKFFCFAYGLLIHSVASYIQSLPCFCFLLLFLEVIEILPSYMRDTYSVDFLLFVHVPKVGWSLLTCKL